MESESERAGGDATESSGGAADPCGERGAEPARGNLAKVAGAGNVCSPPMIPDWEMCLFYFQWFMEGVRAWWW